MPSRAVASSSSMIAGRMPDDTMTAAARAACSTLAKEALSVATGPVCSCRSRSVASTMTPSVPSEPTMSAVRS